MTITLTREEAQQVHDALLNFENDISDAMFAALTTLRARLAQPEPEPVAWMYKPMGETRFAEKLDTPGMHRDESVPLYDAPPQREWKELTTAETKALWNATKKAGAFAALISAKLKEKNNG